MCISLQLRVAQHYTAQDTMGSEKSLLSMSTSYSIIVPRDVPPENFKSVPEAIKVRKTRGRCVARNLIFLLLIVCLTAGLISGVYLAFEQSRNKNRKVEENMFEDVKKENMDKYIGDDHQLLYSPMETDGNQTVYIKHSITGTIQVDPCLSSPCQGGGSCESHDGTFSCYCPPGRRGSRCQERSEGGIKFNQKSFLKLKATVNNSPQTKIIFQFQPSEKVSGIILQTGNLVMRVMDNQLELRLGKDQILVKNIPRNVWTNVSVFSYHRDVMIKINKDNPVTVSLNFKVEDICLGDCLEESEGFVGCVQGLRVGYHLVSVLSGQEPLVTDKRNIQRCSEANN